MTTWAGHGPSAQVRARPRRCPHRYLQLTEHPRTGSVNRGEGPTAIDEGLRSSLAPRDRTAAAGMSWPHPGSARRGGHAEHSTGAHRPCLVPDHVLAAAISWPSAAGSSPARRHPTACPKARVSVVTGSNCGSGMRVVRGVLAVRALGRSRNEQVVGSLVMGGSHCSPATTASYTPTGNGTVT